MEVDGELCNLTDDFNTSCDVEEESLPLGIHLPDGVSTNDYITQLDCEFRLLVKQFCNGCRKKKINKNVICEHIEFKFVV